MNRQTDCFAPRRGPCRQPMAQVQAREPEPEVREENIFARAAPQMLRAESSATNPISSPPGEVLECDPGAESPPRGDRRAAAGGAGDGRLDGPLGAAGGPGSAALLTGHSRAGARQEARASSPTPTSRLQTGAVLPTCGGQVCGPLAALPGPRGTVGDTKGLCVPQWPRLMALP